ATFCSLQGSAWRTDPPGGPQRVVAPGSREDLPLVLVELADPSSVKRGTPPRLRQPGTLACIAARLQSVPSDRNGRHAFLDQPENLGRHLQNEQRHGRRGEPARARTAPANFGGLRPSEPKRPRTPRPAPSSPHP